MRLLSWRKRSELMVLEMGVSGLQHCCFHTSSRDSCVAQSGRHTTPPERLGQVIDRPATRSVWTVDRPKSQRTLVIFQFVAPMMNWAMNSSLWLGQCPAHDSSHAWSLFMMSKGAGPVGCRKTMVTRTRDISVVWFIGRSS
ncbi:hypothetical protein RRG08_057645 [Elysia crispata]|uniref:Uncharacterized protein n=1 Tax=Elysia crispata TaxID=231223 RepID=A0AAE1A1C5_9GAST|nr:hypothetical protein RRG08_057645 [Elysia crispata]